MKSAFFYQTAIGRIGIVENGTAITDVYISEKKLPDDSCVVETELLKEAGRQLQEYFAGQRQSFDLPLAPQGTKFQQKVWEILKTIPYGETRSYKQVAEAIQQPNASRAVGMANNKNPIPIVIPCHRVIGSNGALIGYAGGLERKNRLLQLEKENGGQDNA